MEPLEEWPYEYDLHSLNLSQILEILSQHDGGWIAAHPEVVAHAFAHLQNDPLVFKKEEAKLFSKVIGVIEKSGVFGSRLFQDEMRLKTVLHKENVKLLLAEMHLDQLKELPNMIKNMWLSEMVGFRLKEEDLPGIEFLLKAGANPNKNGILMRLVAKCDERKNSESIEVRVAKLLIEYGADPEKISDKEKIAPASHPNWKNLGL